MRYALWKLPRSWAVITVSPGGDSHVAHRMVVSEQEEADVWMIATEAVTAGRGNKKKVLCFKNFFKAADIISNDILARLFSFSRKIYMALIWLASYTLPTFYLVWFIYSGSLGRLSR